MLEGRENGFGDHETNIVYETRLPQDADHVVHSDLFLMFGRRDSMERL